MASIKGRMGLLKCCDWPKCRDIQIRQLWAMGKMVDGHMPHPHTMSILNTLPHMFPSSLVAYVCADCCHFLIHISLSRLRTSSRGVSFFQSLKIPPNMQLKS